MVLKIGFIVYAIIAIIHLIFCFKEKENARCYSKVFLMSCLLCITVFNGLNKGTISVILILAISSSMIGDIFLLMDNNRKMFACGGFMFFISYVLYIIKMISKLTFKIELYFYIILLAFLLLWCKILSPKLKPYLKELRNAASIYSFTLLFGIIIGLITFLTSSSLTGFILTAGFCLLVVSDLILCVAAFYKSFRRYHFYLMIPYILGQGLIIYGLLR